jgi:putative ABC transport system ATP-binding protein
MTFILQAKNVKRTFQQGDNCIPVLKGVNLEIQKNKLIALKGRSGSGKTTLINLFGGLDTPTEGKILYKDMEISRLSDRERTKLRRQEIGVIFQSFGLVPFMSVYENVELGLRIAGIKSKERKSRIKEVLDLVGMIKRKDHRPHELSGGEQQRCAVARVIACRPSLVLADEPTAELDSKIGLRLIEFFKQLVHEEDMTIILTTHNEVIMEVADVTYELQDGKIIGKEMAFRNEA